MELINQAIIRLINQLINHILLLLRTLTRDRRTIVWSSCVWVAQNVGYGFRMDFAMILPRLCSSLAMEFDDGKALKSSPGGSKSTLGGSKMKPGSSRDGWKRSETPKIASKSGQERTKSLARASKSVPRAPKRPPRGAQRAAKTLQKAPGRTPEVPKGSPREPKSRLNREKIASGTHRVVNSVLERDFSTFLKELVSLE